MNYRSGSATVDLMPSAMRRLAASLLFEMQAPKDTDNTDNQILIIKFGLQKTMISLLTYAELHPGILGFLFYLGHAISIQNLFFNLLIPTLVGEPISFKVKFIQIIEEVHQNFP